MWLSDPREVWTLVRAWHPDVVGYLDDERLLANHSESHMMINALERHLRGDLGMIGWLTNPETAVFVDRPEVLAWLHEHTVAEMRRRGFPSGHRHQTPVQFEPVWDGEWSDPGFGYKPSLDSWLLRDLADLYVKWTAEGRWLEDGTVLLGRRRSCEDLSHCWKGHRTRHDPAPHVWELASQPDRELMRSADQQLCPRDNLSYDREAIRLVLLKYHGSRSPDCGGTSD